MAKMKMIVTLEVEVDLDEYALEYNEKVARTPAEKREVRDAITDMTHQRVIATERSDAGNLTNVIEAAIEWRIKVNERDMVAIMEYLDATYDGDDGAYRAALDRITTGDAGELKRFSDYHGRANHQLSTTAAEALGLDPSGCDLNTHFPYRYDDPWVQERVEGALANLLEGTFDDQDDD
jgi:hypothetical protein